MIVTNIPDLHSGVAQSSISVPLNVVARVLANEEGLGAAHVSVRVEALLDGVVEDLALADGLGLHCGQAGSGEAGDEDVLEGNVHGGGIGGF